MSMEWSKTGMKKKYRRRNYYSGLPSPVVATLRSSGRITLLIYTSALVEMECFKYTLCHKLQRLEDCERYVVENEWGVHGSLKCMLSNNGLNLDVKESVLVE